MFGESALVIAPVLSETKLTCKVGNDNCMRIVPLLSILKLKLFAPKLDGVGPVDNRPSPD